jgi:hypothetical protein
MSLFWLRRPNVPLLVLLVTMLIVFPFIERSGVGRCVVNLVVVTGIVLSLHRVRVSPRGVLFVLVCGAVAVAGQILYETGLRERVGLVSALSQTACFAGAAALMCRYMMRDARATVDELFAAAVAYMLMALAWATAYWSIEHVRPGSFAINFPALPDRRTWFEFFYLSMTTLTTTGFGDVAPVSSVARAAVMLEQFIGVLYVALVISRLAGFAGGRSGRRVSPMADELTAADAVREERETR